MKVTPETALETAARVDAKIAAGRTARPARRHPDDAEGQHLDQRHRNELLLENSEGLCADLRRDRLEPSEKAERRSARQDEHGRVRHGFFVRNLLLRRGEKPARHLPRGGRQQRRRCLRRGRQTSPRTASAPTPAAPSASPQASAASSASSRPTAPFRATASLPTLRASTRSGRSRRAWKTPRSFTTPFRAYDEMDSTSSGQKEPVVPSLGNDIRGKKNRRCQGIFRRRAPGREQSAAERHGCLPLARRGNRGTEHAVHQIQPAGLLYSRVRRGFLEPRAVRRHPLRLPDGALRRPQRHGLQNAQRGLRRGSQAPHPARHLCAQRGILRRLLQKGAESARNHREGVRRNLRKMRRDSRADRPDDGFPGALRRERPG